MRPYTIITDSCCDLSAEMARELEIKVLPLRLTLEGKDYANRLDGREIGFKEFYDKLREGHMSTTSAVSAGLFEEAMRRELREGRDVLCLTFSSALSATHQSAVIAAEECRERFPEGKVLVADTLCASLGQGLLVTLCAEQKRLGKTLEEVHAFALEARHRVCHWVMAEDLHHLKRGGRISAATATFGTMLSIKPLIHVDPEGRLVSVGKARGRKAGLQALADKVAATAVNPAEQTIFISHADCREDADALAEAICSRCGTEKFCINYIGPVIGSHTGPGTIALFFLGKER